MNNDINQPQGSQPTGGLGLPPLPSIPETPTAPPPMPSAPPPPEPVLPSPLPTLPEVPTPPSEPLTEVSTGLPTLEPIAPPTPTPEEKPKEEAVKPVKPKRKISKKLAIGGTLVLLLIGGVIAFASQFGLLRIGLQPRAGSPCSPNGSTDCGADGVKTECVNYQWQVVGTCTPAEQQAGQQIPGQTPTTTIGGGQTGGPPVVTATPATGTVCTSGAGCYSPGVCPLGAAYCGGCISACRTVTNKTCQQMINEECVVATAAPTVTATPGTGGAGGGGITGDCSGSLSHPACKACGSPGPCVYQNTQGYCSTTTGNNCSWNFAEICTPNQTSNGSDGKCYICDGGSSWVKISDSPCSVAPTATITPPPSPTSAAGTGCGPTGLTKCEGGRSYVCENYSWKDTGACEENRCIPGDCKSFPLPRGSVYRQCNTSGTAYEGTYGTSSCGGNVPGGSCTGNVSGRSGTCSADRQGCGTSGYGEEPAAQCSIYSVCCVPSAPTPTPGGQACTEGGGTGTCTADAGSCSGAALLDGECQGGGGRFWTTGFCCIATTGACTTLGAPCTTSSGSGNCRATGAPDGSMYCQVTTASVPTGDLGTCRCDYGSKTGEVGPYTCKDASGNVTLYQPFRTGCIGSTSISGTGGATGPGSQTQASCGNSGQSCCVPENFPGQSVNICNAGLYCNNGTCTTSAAVCGGPGGTGTTATAKCKVFKCGSKCNNGNTCSLGESEVDCASASLGGQCGQIDYIGDTGGYCGVMVQNCYGSCAGTTTTTATGGPSGGGAPPTTTTTTTTTTTVAPACVNTRIFINGSTTVATAEQMSAIKIGDTIRMVVQGNNASLAGARFIVKIGGNDVSNGGFEVTAALSPIQASGVREFYYDYPITQGGAYTIEGYVNSVPPTVTATPVPTVIPTATATVTATPTPIVEGGIYGNGADGVCTTTGSVSLNNGSCAGRSTADAVHFRMTANVASGAATLTLASVPNGLAIGDEILVINLQGTTGVGDYETVYVAGISGNALTLNKALTKSFNGTTNKIMVQRVPHYTSVNVGGTLTAGGYSCSSFLGGVLFFRANDAVNVASGSGTIDMTGKGFAGGAVGDQVPGQQGVSQLTCGAVNSRNSNGGGGGGGGANAWNIDPKNGAGGGGGGYGAAGGGGANSTGGNQGGGAGGAYGVADLMTKMYLGSGGGEGGNEANGPSGSGGAGGGVIAIFGDSITVAGQINSSGTNATAAYNTAGGGGGGAGGSVLLYGKSLTLGTKLVKAAGGTGSAGPKGGQGGNGGVGRISVRYQTTGTGTTTPASQSAVLVSNVVTPSVAGASSDRVMSFLEKLIKLIKP